MSDQKEWNIGLEKKPVTSIIVWFVGLFFIVLGLAGLLYEEFAGAHLSWLLSLLYIATGLLCAIAAASKNREHAYFVSIAGAIFTGLLAGAALFFGDYGVPQVGFDAPDPFHVQIIPKLLELGTVDLIMNLLVCGLFTFAAWRHYHKPKEVTYKD